jgi:hypothetical protein
MIAAAHSCGWLVCTLAPVGLVGLVVGLSFLGCWLSGRQRGTN